MPRENRTLTKSSGNSCAIRYTIGIYELFHFFTRKLWKELNILTYLDKM